MLKAWYQLSAYQASSPSQCGLIADSVYNVLPDDVGSIFADSTGWTTFHLFVSIILYVLAIEKSSLV